METTTHILCVGILSILFFVLPLMAQHADPAVPTTPSVNPAVTTTSSVNSAVPTTTSVNSAVTTTSSVNPTIPTQSATSITIIPSAETIKACMGTILQLTCITKGYSSAHWSSNEYIDSQNGHRLEFERRQVNRNVTSTIDPNTTAALVSSTTEDGLVVLKINLLSIVSVGGTFACGAGDNEQMITVVVDSSCTTTGVPTESPITNQTGEDPTSRGDRALSPTVALVFTCMVLVFFGMN